MASTRPETADRWLPAAGGLAHAAARADLDARPLRPRRRRASRRQAERGPAPIVVTVTPVKRADFPVVLQSIGQVQAYNTVLVRARVDGQIMKIAFKEGQMVKQGRSSGADRRQTVSGRARSGRRQEIAGRGQSRQRQARSRPLSRRSPSRTSPPSSNSTPRTRWCCSSPPRSPPTPRRSTPRGRNSTIRPSAPRSRAAPGSASSTKAISSAPASRPGSSRSRNCSRSPSSSPSRRNM